MKRFIVFLLLVASCFASVPKTLNSSVAFTDPQNNVLANGKVVFILNAGAQVIGGGQVVQGLTVVASLTAGGLMPNNFSLWANDQLQPSNTFYIVRMFNSNGLLVRGPENWILAGPSPIDVAVQTNSSPTAPVLTLKTNSVINGNSAPSGFGGGIASGAGTVTISNSVITGNSAIGGKIPSDGGGIAVVNSGTLTLTNTTITDNTANTGGGISYAGCDSCFVTVTITNSTVSGNSVTTGDGGCIVITSNATVTVSNSTINGNSAPGTAGPILPMVQPAAPCLARGDWGS